MIYIGADHAGFQLKGDICRVFPNQFIDLGTNSADSCDYPVIAKAVCSAVIESPENMGILICGTGTGMSICANKHKNIRAANCWTSEIARLAREHNNANILCLGARFISTNAAIDIVNTFLNTKFSEEPRHRRRLDLIER